MATDVRNMGLRAAGIAELEENPIQEGENSTPNNFNNFHNRNGNFKAVSEELWIAVSYPETTRNSSSKILLNETIPEQLS